MRHICGQNELQDYQAGEKLPTQEEEEEMQKDLASVGEDSPKACRESFIKNVHRKQLF